MIHVLFSNWSAMQDVYASVCDPRLPDRRAGILSLKRRRWSILCVHEWILIIGELELNGYTLFPNCSGMFYVDTHSSCVSSCVRMFYVDKHYSCVVTILVSEHIIFTEC